MLSSVDLLYTAPLTSTANISHHFSCVLHQRPREGFQDPAGLAAPSHHLATSASPNLFTRVVDPDPDSETLWIRIRSGNPDPGARKLKNFSGKSTFWLFKKNLLLKRYKIALTTF
jgi:hypothetical protein